MPIWDLVLGPVVEVVNKVIDKTVVDSAASQRMKDEVEKAVALAGIQGVFSQLDINKEEAKSASIWVAGWRPFIGWVCGSGLAVQFILIPTIAYFVAMFGYPPPKPLILDPMVWQVMTGILGLNIVGRTYEKVKGAASNH